MRKHYPITFGLISILFACSEYSQESREIVYQADMEEFINPERGFYRPFGVRASKFEPLDATKLLKLRHCSKIISHL